MSQQVLNAEYSSDSVRYTVIPETHEARFEVQKVDHIKSFMRLVATFQERVVGDDVDTILVWFRNRRYAPKVKDPVHGEITQLYDDACHGVVVKEVTPKGSQLLACPLGEFYFFIQKHLKYLVQNEMISYDEIHPETDEDGWTEVVDLKKQKYKKRQQVRRILGAMTHYE